MLPDLLRPGLAVVFVGTSKSTTSVASGHYYANPTNMFWNLLQAAGLTGGVWLGPSRDREVLSYSVGLTDLVPRRAASSDALLRDGDFDVEGFVEKIEHFAPQVIAFNGERASAKVARFLGEAPAAEGAASWSVASARAYRLPSSSSAHAKGGYAAKRAKWEAFGAWLAER